MEFRSFHTIQTAENVPIRLEVAGLASRIYATGIDTVISLTLTGLWILLLSLPPITQNWPELGKTLIPLGLFLMYFGYYLVQEWLWDGKTVGKSLLRIRVVRTNGQAIGFWEALGRSLLRVVDVSMGGIGLLCMMLNAQEKRLGDLLAGTLVIRHQPVRAHAPLPPDGADPPGLSANVSTEATQSVGLSRLTTEEGDLLGSFLNRRKTLQTPQRTAMAEALSQYFSTRLHQPFTQGETDLEHLWQQYHQQRDAAAQPPAR